MTENELLAELKNELSYSPIEPDEVTCKMVQEATGLSDTKVMDKLNKKVGDGTLTRRRVKLPTGFVVWAFRKA